MPVPATNERYCALLIYFRFMYMSMAVDFCDCAIIPGIVRSVGNHIYCIYSDVTDGSRNTCESCNV